MADSPSLPATSSLPYIEHLYEDYLRDHNSVPGDWRRFFESLNGDQQVHSTQGHSRLTNRIRSRSKTNASEEPVRESPPTGDEDVAVSQDRVDQLLRAYRVRGHMAARIDPLDLPRAQVPELEPEFYGFGEADMDRPFSSRTVAGADVQTLREIVERLRSTYCRSIGVQFMHIDALDLRHWLQEKMEGTENRVHLGRSEQLRILTRLTQAVLFEEFVQKKYIGAKTFSLEGCESLIPLLEMAIEKAGAQGIDEIVMGMAHRGRLNVLVNIMGKPAQDVFREFEDSSGMPVLHGGDVKYHQGYSSDWTTLSGHGVHLSLCFNPSHLEFINPVAVGRMRAKQDRTGDPRREKRGMVLLIHGDASFAAQGVVQETLNLSELEGYSIGGTVHVVVNNQIGFTTSPEEARSSIYATAIAKMLQIPIFHVNGEDPEAVAQVIHLAMDFREEFMRDVVIDMYGYRRQGHNEADEPSFTQPLLYRAIRNRKSVRDGYLDNLLTMGGISQAEADGIVTLCRNHLEKGWSAARSADYVPAAATPAGIWTHYVGGPDTSVEEVDTGVNRDLLASLLERMTQLPEAFHLHPKLDRGMKARREMAAGKRPIDWSAAEALALASLAVQGVPIRLSGQDTARGTFSQRHAVLHDVENGTVYTPLQHLTPTQACVEIINSPLSETGALGFEYGYSLDRPEGLVLWEAQFGDFCNAAQVIIDQFIAAAAAKWRRLSGIGLLLPHGFEGQGSEHSSARLERFLTLAADDNIQIVNLTTPAQYFHCLRRQVLRRWRKPLIIMTPKSLLRHPQVGSTMADLAEGAFQRIIPDNLADTRSIRRILLCSGKIYYELLARRENARRLDVSIVRVEQLYPLREETLEPALAEYTDGTPAFFVQEEPENMGAWRYMRHRFGDLLCGRFPFSRVSRPESASPGASSAGGHKQEQQQLIVEAFNGS